MLRQDSANTALARIHNHFAERIKSGDIDVGQKLPSEFQIAKQFSVSRATVQSAMSRLTLEGWIERFPGKGTFARMPDNEERNIGIDIHNILSFEDNINLAGDSVTYQLISFGRATVTKRAARALGVEVGSSAFALERLRKVKGKCIGIEKRFFSPQLSLNLDTETMDKAPTHVLIEDHLRLKITRIEASLRAVVADEYQAQLIGIETNAPMLVREHTIYGENDQVILHGDSSYIEDFAFRYTAQISGL